MTPSLDLSGVVIVTGCANMRSIGRATALRAAELGADVVVTDIERPPERIGDDEREAGWRGLESLAEQVRSRGRRCEVVYCDVARRSEVEALVARAAELGPVTGLVNAARAFADADRHLVDLPADEWDLVMAVNVRGPMTCSAVAARAMMARGSSGSIVNISSIRGTHPVPGKGAYATSKAALEMVTRVMALELGPHGIRVNAVAPGTVATNRIRIGEREDAADQGLDADAYRQRWLRARASQSPLGRVAQPEDIASAVVFLLSEASGYITGECIQVSGGRAAM